MRRCQCTSQVNGDGEVTQRLFIHLLLWSSLISWVQGTTLRAQPHHPGFINGFGPSDLTQEDQRIVGVNTTSFMELGDDGCRRAASVPCIPLQSHFHLSTCFGTPLPYKEISPELVNGNWTIYDIQNDLERWQKFQAVPKCWAVIQPFLCSVYMPKCQDKVIDLPSQKLCKITRGPCKIVEQVLKTWPEFLKCDDASRFPPNCKKSDISTLKFNMSGKCEKPMIQAENDFNHYEGFEGCALTCKDPVFTDNDHDYISALTFFWGCGALLANGLVIVTFLMNWKSANKYPSVVIFYVNLCYFIAVIGWMLQFFPNGKEEVVCRKDFTIRRNELTSGENVLCVLVFVLIYFGTMSALAWLVVFAYVWNLTVNSVGRIRGKIDRKTAYFHTFSWAFGIVLTLVSLSLGKVDGNSISGICYVGFYDPAVRIGLVLVPIGVAFTGILFYFWRGCYYLLTLLRSSSDFITPDSRLELKAASFRVIVFSVFTALMGVTFLGLEIYHIGRRPAWQKSLRQFLLCRIGVGFSTSSDISDCEVEEKPRLALVVFNILIFFAGAIMVSTWAWTGASVQIWKRFFTRHFPCCSQDPSQSTVGPTIPKHKLISKAFAQRHQMSANGRLSLSLGSTHDDPVGLNRMLDPSYIPQNQKTHGQDRRRRWTDGENGIEDSNGSNLESNTQHRSDDVSSEWAAALPHLISRRGAIIPDHPSSVSCLSEDSCQVRRPSIDSCENLGNEKPFQSSTSDLEGGDHGSHKRSRRRDWFRSRRNKRAWSWGRRPNARGHGGSSSSLESSGAPKILPVITALIDKKLGRAGGDGDPGEPAPVHLPLLPIEKKTIICKELAIQTSIEHISVLAQGGGGGKYSNNPHNFSNFTMCDKATQSSLKSLHEIGTQTKKSATKKKKDSKLKSKKTDEIEPESNGLLVGSGNKSCPNNDLSSKIMAGGGSKNQGSTEQHDDPVLKLLSPV